VDRDPEHELVTRAQSGDTEALSELVDAQRSLAMAIARRYDIDASGIDVALAILRERVPEFDASGTHKFSTWTTWWLRRDLGVSG
jgi:DNA-directed RNA polymerase sigma subunit (sigma70/sigma32)